MGEEDAVRERHVIAKIEDATGGESKGPPFPRFSLERGGGKGLVATVPAERAGLGPMAEERDGHAERSAVRAGDVLQPRGSVCTPGAVRCALPFYGDEAVSPGRAPLGIVLQVRRDEPALHTSDDEAFAGRGGALLDAEEIELLDACERDRLRNTPPARWRRSAGRNGGGEGTEDRRMRPSSGATLDLTVAPEAIAPPTGPLRTSDAVDGGGTV